MDIREEHTLKRFILIALMFSTFSTYPSSIVSSISLLELGEAFNQPIGVIAQIRSIAFVVALFSALIIGALSVRVNPKTILLMGLLLLSISALGSGASINLLMLFSFFSLSGMGTAMVEPMINTIIGEHFNPRERARTLGLTAAAGGLSFILGGYIVNMYVSLGGWRLAFLGYAMLLPLIALLFSAKIIPGSGSGALTRSEMSDAFKAIFSNRSALGCLIGNLFSSASVQGLYFYSFSFLRDNFVLSSFSAASVYSISSVFFFVGSYFSGRLVNSFGRKNALIFSLLFISLSTILYTNILYPLVSILFILLGYFFCALQYSSSNGLSLEQTPRFRGTMMSLNSSAMYVGYTLGTGLGGYVLLQLNWNFFGVFLGLAALIAAMIIFLLTVDL